MRTSSKSCFWAVAVLLSGAAAFASACGGSGDDTRTPTATAGSGNATTGGSTSVAGTSSSVGGSSVATGGSGTGGSTATACDPSQTCCPTTVCKCPYPQGDGTTDSIDNMEDGTSKFKTANLMTAAGYWDLSKGADSGTVAGLTGSTTDTQAITPDATTGANNTTHSMHFTGMNLTAWGSALAAELSNGCPFDASKYGGITFYAKGTSTVFEGTNKLLVLVGNPEYIPTENGGFCNDSPSLMPPDPNCYARHRVTIDLTADWKQYTVAWSDLQPPSYFTTGHPFGPDRVRDIVFNASGPSGGTMDAAGQPFASASFDVWIDELAFVPTGATSVGLSGTGGASSTTGRRQRGRRDGIRRYWRRGGRRHGGRQLSNR